MRLMGTSMGLDAFAGAGWLVMVGIIAVIVLTVVGYIKFVGKNADRTSRASKFFQFDHFYLERILKAIYLFSVVCITVFALIAPFAALFTTAGVGASIGTVFVAFFSTLVGSALSFLVLQFFCRIMFESSLMFIRLVVDARDIRNAVHVAPAEAASSARPETQPMPATWTCSCGRSGNTGSFCGSCGRPRL